MAGRGETQLDVFINCPFDDKYAATLRALVFAIQALGFRPRSALELDDGGQARIEKIVGIIRECRYGIHDLSRTELDPSHKLPRFNMPLELGLFLGAKRFGGPEQRQKRLLILDVDRYRYQRFVSDLAGIDIHEHQADPVRALRETRDWLANVTRSKLPSASRIEDLYQKFRSDLPALATTLGFDPSSIPYADFQRIVAEWLLEARY